MFNLLKILLQLAGLMGHLISFFRVRSRKPVLMVLAPGSLQATINKGVEHQLTDFACEDLFKKVIFYHFHVAEPLSKELSSRVQVIETAPIEFLGVFNIIRYMAVALDLAYRHQVSIIRSTDPYIRGGVAAFLGRLINIPFCISIHADYDKRYCLDGARGAPEIFGSRAIAKKFEAFVMNEAELILPIRESLIPFAESSGVDTSKIHVIPHGLNLDRYANGLPEEPSVHKLFALPKNRPIVSFVGRLSKENYVYDILTVASLLKQKGHDNLLFLMAGDGPERDSLKSEIARLDLAEQVFLLGFQPSDIVVAIRRQSNIGFALMGGFSLIEACAAGMPVVSYDIEWHYELVKNEDTGYLVSEGDIEQLAVSVIALLDEPDIALQMGKNAKELALSRHSLTVANKYKIDAYHRLLLK